MVISTERDVSTSYSERMGYICYKTVLFKLGIILGCYGGRQGKDIFNTGSADFEPQNYLKSRFSKDFRYVHDRLNKDF